MYRCAGCGSGYLDPRPTSATIGLAYQSYYTHDPAPSSESLGWMRRWQRALANGYRNAEYGADLRPASHLGPLLAKLSPTSRSRLDAGLRHLPKHQGGGRLLDIGCGNGTFLDFAVALGWQAEGIDLDEAAVQTARRRGLRVRRGRVEDLRENRGLYDVLTLSHVIEHVHAPLGLLERCFELLRPGGKLWLETPNLHSLGHAIYGESWRGLEPPRHLVLFTWASISWALETVGFRDVQPMPYRPLAREMFCASESIRTGDAGGHGVRYTAGLRRLVARSDRRAQRLPGCREFITLTAIKPA